MKINPGAKMPMGNWFYRIQEHTDKLYPKYGLVEFVANEGEIDIVAVVKED